MPSRIADIPVPPRCREMIRTGALVAISTSGGKDSQAMTILLSRIVPHGQIVAVHAPLGEVEWPDTIGHLEATLPKGVPLIFAPVASGKTLLQRVEERGLWPSNSARWCTSDFKTGPIQRELRRYLRAHPRFGGRLVNAMGMRAEESPARAQKTPWRRNNRMSVAGREAFDWLPVFDLSTEGRIPCHPRRRPDAALGLRRRHVEAELHLLHPGVRADLRRAAELRPDLYRRYAEIERRIGHTLSPSRVPLPELTGISPSDSGDGADAMGLAGPRTRPAPARQRLARRSGVKPRWSRSGAERGDRVTDGRPEGAARAASPPSGACP